MTVVNEQTGFGRFMFFFVLLLFAFGAYHYTSGDVFTEHYATDDFASLMYAFQAISYGDIDGFFTYLLDGIVFIGLFMVIFALVHFLFSHPLKTVFVKKRYATILALVFTGYVFYNHRIYNYIMSLNAFSVGFLVFSALIIMIWGASVFWWKDSKHLRDDVKRTREEMYVQKRRAQEVERKIAEYKKLHHM